MKKIVRVFRKFLSGEIRLEWGTPSPTDYLILDSSTGQILSEILEGEGKVTFLESRFLRYRNKTIPISFVLGFKTIVFRFKGLNLFNSYLAACIEQYNPKWVLDRGHSLNILELSDHFPAVQFGLVQNGSWLRSMDTKVEARRFVQQLSEKELSARINCHVFCFGPDDVDKVNANCLERASGLKCHPIGSLVAGFFQTLEPAQNRKLEDNKKWDICLISQAVPARLNTAGTLSERRKQAYPLINQHLARFIKESGKTAIICPRLSDGMPDAESEYEFFKNSFGDSESIKIFEKNDRFDSYRAIAQSDVIISLYSSMGIESVGMSKKVAFFPYFHDDVFRLFSDRYENDQNCWRWIESRLGYDHFKSLLMTLCEMPETEYCLEYGNQMRVISGSCDVEDNIEEFKSICREHFGTVKK